MKDTIIISPFFAPDDSGIPLYNTTTAKYIAGKGHRVTVLTGVPFYPQWKVKPPYDKSSFYTKETEGNVKILRVKIYVPEKLTFVKRVVQIIHFSFFSVRFIFALPKKSNIFVVVPYTSCILTALIVKFFRGGKIWSHVQDFEFDAATQIMNFKFLKSTLFKIESTLLNRCDKVSTISNAMMTKLVSKTNTPSYLFANYIDTNSFQHNTTQHPYHTCLKKPHLLYSGNIGEKQDWELFVRFCKIAEGKLNITIVGDGGMKTWVENQIDDIEGVFLRPPVPFDEVSSLLNSFDGHLLFQKNSIVDSVMPSKLLGMMLSQKPCFLTGNENSETNKIITDSKGGVFMSNPNPNHMFEIINSLLNNNKKAQKMGHDAKAYIETNFSQKKILSNFYNEFIKI